MSRPFDLVIFDCDGVLVDSEMLSAEALLGTFASFGVAIDLRYFLERCVGRSLATILSVVEEDTGFAAPPDFGDLFAQRLYEAFRADLRPIDGIGDVLGRLHVPFCVATSGYADRVALALELTGLAHRFAGRVFTASMVKAGKPAPDLFLHAARECGARPERCLVIEDSEAGIIAAHAAGMRVWRFTGGSHFREGVPDYRADKRPDRTFATMAELEAALIAEI